MASPQMTGADGLSASLRMAGSEEQDRGVQLNEGGEVGASLGHRLIPREMQQRLQQGFSRRQRAKFEPTKAFQEKAECDSFLPICEWQESRHRLP